MATRFPKRKPAAKKAVKRPSKRRKDNLTLSGLRARQKRKMDLVKQRRAQRQAAAKRAKDAMDDIMKMGRQGPRTKSAAEKSMDERIRRRMKSLGDDGY